MTTTTRTHTANVAAEAIRQDRRRRTRKRWANLARVLIIAATLAAAGWMLMLVVDVVHDHWIPACPTIGYRHALALACLLRGVVLLLGTSPNLDNGGAAR